MWQWVLQHQFAIGVVAMYVFSAVTQALPQPQSSSGWYLFTFNLIHALAANFGNLRAMSASKVAKPALFVVILVALAGGAGCAKHVVLHPGAVDEFDSQTYDALLVAQASLNEAKAQTEAGALPAAAVAPLNEAIKAYDVAEAAWQAYHAAGATDAAKRELQTALAAMTAALGELQKLAAKGGAR